MDTILEYIEKFNHCTFAEKPFNDVDSLILSQLSYIHFEALTIDLRICPDFLPLKELTNVKNLSQMFGNTYNEAKMRQLYFAVLCSQRFGTMKVKHYIAHTDPLQETQFAAITFLIEDQLLYIAFRGTDSTIIGWKEDFNMTFMEEIPAQLYSVQYFNEVAAQYDYPILVGGHSKGGNLAIYAATECLPALQNRITAIYSHDGPGFPEKFVIAPQYQKIRDRMHLTIPKTAIIGTLLTTLEPYQVVQSDGFALFQHDPFSWQIENGNFIYMPSVDAASIAIQKTLNTWLLEIDVETRKSFINVIFNLLYSTNSFTFKEFYDNLRKNLSTLFQQTDKLDHKTTEFITKTIELVIATTFHSFKTLPRLSARCFYCKTKMTCAIDSHNHILYHCPKCGKFFQEIEETSEQKQNDLQ